ncbi:MAG: dihydroorotate dehydrogenase electron transfer subunit [Mycoplasmatales bacterium]
MIPKINVIARVVTHQKIAKDVYKLVLEHESFKAAKVGQFAMIEVPNKYLKRPISISQIIDNQLTFVYKTFGQGTKNLSESQALQIKVIPNLGDSVFEVSKIPQNTTKVQIVAGGIGVAPMVELVKQLANSEQKLTIAIHLGYRTKSEVFLVEDFEQIIKQTNELTTSNVSVELDVYTEDGSFGTKGYPTQALNLDDYTFACGPMPLLKAVKAKTNEAQLSVEAHMACGIGICSGCVVKTKNGYEKSCKSGPVFEASNLLFEEPNEH